MSCKPTEAHCDQEMYQASVGLQGQINALIKKYSDQKGQSRSPQYLAENLTTKPSLNT
jgi:hypothetical protein